MVSYSMLQLMVNAAEQFMVKLICEAQLDDLWKPRKLLTVTKPKH